MPLIDRSYFDGPLILPVTGEDGKAVDAAIARWEPVYLRGVLGASLAAAFEYGLANPSNGYFDAAYFDGSYFDTGTIDARWLAIRDGRLYQYGGRSYNWPGLVTALKQSPIANYVYYQHRKQTHTQTTGIGEGKLTGENAVAVSPSRKMLDAWAEMVQWNSALWGLISTQQDTDGQPLYPELVACEVDRNLFQDAYAW